MKPKKTKQVVRLILGVVSLTLGFVAANLALFHWIEQTGIYYLLGEFSRYACAYGGFAAMILGALLINDFLTARNLPRKQSELDQFIQDLDRIDRNA